MKCTVRKISFLFIVLVGSAVFFVSCGPGSDCLAGCEDLESKFYFRLEDSGSVFKIIKYNTLKEIIDTPFSSRAEFRLNFSPPTTQVIFETTQGWDTLVYQVNSSSQLKEYASTGGNRYWGVRMDIPVILSHTFDSVYYEENTPLYGPADKEIVLMIRE